MLYSINGKNGKKARNLVTFEKNLLKFPRKCYFRPTINTPLIIVKKINKSISIFLKNVENKTDIQSNAPLKDLVNFEKLNETDDKILGTFKTNKLKELSSYNIKNNFLQNKDYIKDPISSFAKNVLTKGFYIVN